MKRSSLNEAIAKFSTSFLTLNRIWKVAKLFVVCYIPINLSSNKKEEKVGHKKQAINFQQVIEVFDFEGAQTFNRYLQAR